MHNLYKDENVSALKKRIKDARSELHLTQEQLAIKLGDNDRSRVANWESPNNKSLLKIYDVPNVCDALQIDPNHLFGYSEDKISNLADMAKALNLSYEGANTLISNPTTARFIDFLLTSEEFHTLFNNIGILYANRMLLKPLTSVFTDYGLKCLQKAFSTYSTNNLVMDMTKEDFAVHLTKYFNWDTSRYSFIDYVKRIISDERYYDMVLSSPIMNESDDNKFYSFIADIANVSYKYLWTDTKNELALHKITENFNKLTNEFIKKEEKEVVIPK